MRKILTLCSALILIAALSFTLAACGKKKDTSTVPAAVATFSATAGNGQVVLNWTAGNDGGKAITGYEMIYNITENIANSTWENPTEEFTANTFTFAATGLNNGIAYTFKIRALNEKGAGAEKTITATPVAVPNAVSSFNATAGIRQIAVEWTAPANNGMVIEGYQLLWGTTANYGNLTWEDDAVWFNAEQFSFTAGSSEYPLLNATSYTFKIRAVYEEGNGPETTITATTFAVSGEVANFRVKSLEDALYTANGLTDIVLDWDEPSNNGGSAVTGYKIAVVEAGNTILWNDIEPLSASTFTLTKTDYAIGTALEVSIRAVTAVGDGAITTKTITPATVPEQVGDIATEAKNQSVLVTWTAPANGSSEITGYEIMWGPTSINLLTWEVAAETEGVQVQVLGVVTEHTVTGLTNDEWYMFRVRAVNAVGNGEHGQVTGKPAMPAPNAVQTLTATAQEDGTMLIQWTNPLGTPDELAAITGYKIYYGVATDDISIYNSTEVIGKTYRQHTIPETAFGPGDVGREFKFIIVAINAAGEGAQKAVTASPIA